VKLSQFTTWGFVGFRNGSRGLVDSWLECALFFALFILNFLCSLIMNFFLDLVQLLCMLKKFRKLVLGIFGMLPPVGGLRHSST
jgi:hypothetical protein